MQNNIIRQDISQFQLETKLRLTREILDLVKVKGFQFYAATKTTDLVYQIIDNDKIELISVSQAMKQNSKDIAYLDYLPEYKIRELIRTVFTKYDNKFLESLKTNIKKTKELKLEYNMLDFLETTLEKYKDEKSMSNVIHRWFFDANRLNGICRWDEDEIGCLSILIRQLKKFDY
jgi:hypothetical protein